jgi:hypothetical protein
MSQQAIDYVLDLLPPEARRLIDSGRRRDRALDQAILEMEALLGKAQIDPDAAARSSEARFGRIMSRIAERDAHRPWIALSPGLAMRQLWNDRSFLYRCASGSMIPAHEHVREERMIMLAGEVSFGSRRYTAGQCEISPPGTIHEDGWVHQDCTMIVQFAR